jgi:hypothetical protein
VQGPTDTTGKSAAQPDPSLLTDPAKKPDTPAATDKPADAPNADAAKKPDDTTGKTTDKTDAEKKVDEKADVKADDKVDVKADDKVDKKADEKPAGAPEKYEFTAPEGVVLDTKAVEQFEPIARELNLTNDQANKLVALQASIVRQQQEVWAQQRQTWESAVKTDKELGGTALDGNIRLAQSALTKFGTPELRAALDTTGMGNHPELVRVFTRIGKAMAEDTFEKGSPSKNAGKSAAEILYGNPTTK